MQRNFITILTLLLIGVGVWVFAPTQPRGPESDASTPEEAIQAMLDASRRGDDRSYLACFVGGMRSQLEATREQMGEKRFRGYLVDSQAAVQGVATTRLKDPRPDRAACEVEFVLRDKNQRQTVELENDGKRWRIASMSQAAYVKPVIPYGTKVFEEPEKKTGEKAAGP